MFLTCCEEEEPATSRKVETGKVSDVTLTSAIFHGVVNVDISQYSSVTFGVMLSDSKAELNERGGEMFKAKSLIGTDFKIEIGNLNPETKYYYCSWLFLNSTQYEFGDIKEFETQAPSPATVITHPITKIMTNSAVAGGCVKDDGGASVTERGVVYSLSKEPTTSNYKVKSGSGVGEYTCNLTNLQDNAIYYVRAYAINSKGTVYGEERYFTTKEITLPSVYTLNATDVSYTSASVSGNVTDDGNAEVTERGIVYSKIQNPTISDDKIRKGSGIGSFTCNLTDLQDGVTYYVRAYATNLKGTAYGEEKSFTTKTINLPTISTTTASNISYTSATIGGNVSNDGGANVTERGIVYSTSKEPTISNSKVKNGSGTGSFSCNLSNLQDGVTYYVRAYATNLKGTTYGEEKSFTTKTINLPTVSTTNTNNISYTSATVGGNISNDGGANVTERGIVYSTSKGPTTLNSKVKNGSGTGSFSCNLSNLKDGVTYYVRAYATNLKGTAYGEEKSFVTTMISPPTVSTSFTTNVSYTSAIVVGNVTSDGGGNVTERGVVYSTSKLPTISNNKVTNGSGTGSFNCNLSNLQDGTIYYARAYAINQKGTVYGEELSFTTLVITLPIVSTIIATNVSDKSAIVEGCVTNDGGGNITERGIVYSTTPEPTTANGKVTKGTGSGSFSCNLTSLQEATTYYARAYAINIRGVSYGEQVSFKTKFTKGFSISNSKQVFFSSGNLQYHPANKKWRFAENQTDYIGDANTNISTYYNGWVDLFGWSGDNGSAEFGVSASDETIDYYGAFVDWGTNQIGYDAPNTWRTLTSNEWEYILNSRPNASSLRGIAQVNGVNGLILLPDCWICPSDVKFKSGCHTSFDLEYSAYQTFTANQWSKMEHAGAIFLPASGYRRETSVFSLEYYGYYSTATKRNNYYANSIIFEPTSSGRSYYQRLEEGVSVRLVKDL